MNPIARLIFELEGFLVATIGGDRSLLAAINPRRGGAPVKVLKPSRIWAIALYLAAVELQIPNIEIARAVGCQRQNVRQLRIYIEEIRDAEVDRLFERVLDRFCTFKEAQPRTQAFELWDEASARALLSRGPVCDRVRDAS